MQAVEMQPSQETPDAQGPKTSPFFAPENSLETNSLGPNASTNSESFSSGNALVIDVLPQSNGADYGEPSMFAMPEKAQVRDNVIYTNAFQRMIDSEWVPVRAEISAGTIATVLKEKSAELFVDLENLSPSEMEGHFEDEAKKDRIVRKMAYTVAGTVDLLTKMQQDADELLLEKQEIIEVKYNDRLVRELRFYGPDPERPSRMTAPQAMDYLKAHFIDGVQTYQFRGLPVPEEKALITEDDINGFGYIDQRQVARWQNSSFGADNRTVDRIRNMRGENNEMMAEIEKVGYDNLDSIAPDSVAAREIGREGVDYIFGLLGVVSNWNRDFKPEFEAAVKHMAGKYTGLDKAAKRVNKPLAVLFRIRDEQLERARKGLQPSYAAILAGLVR